MRKRRDLTPEERRIIHAFCYSVAPNVVEAVDIWGWQGVLALVALHDPRQDKLPTDRHCSVTERGITYEPLRVYEARKHVRSTRTKGKHRP